MRKKFFISITVMTATILVTILAAALCRNAMAVVVYALVCVAAAVISGIVIDIEDSSSLYSYSWLFYMGGHMMVTITLLLSEWDIPKTQVSTIVIIPFIISAIFCALAE